MSFAAVPIQWSAILARLPRRRSYAGLAVALASGAPLGLALIRSLSRGSLSTVDILADVSRDPITYLYVAASTSLAFGLFAYVLGRQADRLSELSRQDPLTGLSNGRVLRERLHDELARSRRYGQPVSLLLIDVDGLKQVNDRQGHAAGNALLVQVAAALRHGARENDLVARWGGDEFAVLAPATALPDALALAQRLRETLAGRGAEEAASATFSGGVAAAAPRPGDDLEEATHRLWADADAALYAAKRRGRNRVEPTAT